MFCSVVYVRDSRLWSWTRHMLFWLWIFMVFVCHYTVCSHIHSNWYLIRAM